MLTLYPVRYEVSNLHLLRQCGQMVDQEVMKGQLTTECQAEVRVSSHGCERAESRFAQVKRILAAGLHGSSNNQQEDAVKEQEAKPRKRKERHESIGSISQERKVVRSNSAERPVEESKDDTSKHIRRVSSHEDFKKTSQPVQPYMNGNLICIDDVKNFNSPNRVSPHRDPNSDFIKDDDMEHEKRRSSERFSRPLAPRGRRANFGRKRKSKVFGKAPTVRQDDIYLYREEIINNNTEKVVENEKCEERDEVKNGTDLVSNFLQLHTTERERSPSPVHTPATPALDLSKLHEQIDFSEPIPSSSSWNYSDTNMSESVASVRMLLSPRNSIIMTRRIFMDTDIPMVKDNDPKNPVEQRIKQITKQINNLKKKIKKFEEDFECQNGYRPSHSDKQDDKTIKKFCSDLNKLRKELKQLKDDPLSVMCNAVSKTNTITELTGKSRSTQIKETLTEVEKRLAEKRASNNRSEKIDEMSNEELMEEKVAVQKALLFFESIYGRPSSKEDRDLARPLYDRYRTLKRMVARSGLTKLNNSASELATIHEHETMDFVSLPTQVTEQEPEKPSIPTSASTDSSDTETSIGENLHSLPLDDLLEQQRTTNEEKKKLRRSLKEFENDFQTKTGRKLQKDDRLPMENVYSSYKQAKAKLRLLEALIAKHTQ